MSRKYPAPATRNVARSVSSRGDAQRAVDRHARVEQRSQLLGEEQNVVALAALQRRQFERGSRLLLQADIDGIKPWRFSSWRPALSVLGGELAGADFTVRCCRARKMITSVAAIT